MRLSSAALVSIATVLLATAAAAQEIEPRASITAGYSDNPYQSHSSETPTSLMEGLVGLNVLHQGTLLFVDADASIAREQFLSGGVPSQWLPYGSADLVASFVPDLFSWSIQDTIGQVSDQPFNALYAGGRETVNAFSTGPNLLVPLGERNHIEARLQYGRANFDGTNINNNRYDGFVGIFHELTRTSNISADYSYRRIEYSESDLYPTIQIQSPFLRYTLEAARTELIVEGGLESLSYGSAPNTQTPHVLLSIERHISPRLTFQAEYTHAYTDAVQQFVAGSRSVFATGMQNVQAVAAPSKTDSGYFTLSRTAGRGLASLEFTATQDSYDGEPLLDRRTFESDLAVDYRLSSLVSLDVTVGWYRQSFTATDQWNNWEQGSIALVRQLGESLSVSVEYLRAQGTGSLPASSFNENRGLLTLTYDPAGTMRRKLFDPTAPFRYYNQSSFARPAQATQSQ